jgi:hypothetical protein
MTMLSQVLAVVVAAVLLAWRARARGASTSTRSTAVAAVIAILTFVSLSGLWATCKTLRDERSANAALSPADSATRGGAQAGANVGFVEWVNGNLPAGAGFHLSNGGDEATYQWLTYRLYPRVAIADPARAHWIVFLKVTPEAAGFKRREFSRVMQFAPDLFLAERRS